MLEINSAKVTATPGASGWVQVYEFAPEDISKLNFKGKLFVILATKNSGEEIDKISAGRDFISKLNNEYYNSQIEKPFDALRDATQKTITAFKESWGDIEIACCTFVNGVVYSVASGGTRVVIFRGGALATILSSQNGDVITASGFPQKNDKILLGTKSFFQEISDEVIKNTLANDKMEAVAETFTPLVHGNGGGGTSGTLVINFDDKENLIKETFEPVVPNSQPQLPQKPFEDKIKSILTGIGSKLPKRGIYLKERMGDEATSQSRKMTFSIGIVLLVILVVSIGFGIRQKKVNDLKKKYQTILASATQDVTQAISLASVSPDESRGLFLSSEQKLAQIQALKVKDAKVDELQKKIEDSREAILGEYNIAPELFLDLGLLSSGFKGDSLSSSGGNIFILDKAGSRIVSIATDTKKSEVVAGPSVIENPEGIASYQDSIYVLLSDGIYDVTSGKTKVIEKTWSGSAFIYAFAGNMYVLDKDGNAIYRYAGASGSTFGDQQKWLSSATTVNFSGVINWGMNGAVYVMYPNSKILKYSLGSPQNFSLTGILPEIGSVDALNADPDNQYVYLLDKSGSRVVVIDKNGAYKAQYKDPQIAGATGLVASESEKKIILLTGDKLLSIELKGI